VSHWLAADTLSAYEEQAMELAERNAVTDFDIMEEQRPTGIMRAPQASVTAVSATPADLLRIAVESGADLDRLERLMDLQTKWEAKEAKRAYDTAFANFKAESIAILKGRKVTDGPLKGKSYAELHDVVNAVTPALSRHGLSSSWKLTKDDKDWMEVTCYLRHINGHEESVSMGGPPDAGGAKNAIQARASTKTYLERYTLKAITGLSEQDDDNDGNGSRGDEIQSLVDQFVEQAKSAKTEQEVRDLWKIAAPALKATKDVPAFNDVKKAVENKIADFKAAK
jgi:hypothetical protein